MICFKVVTRHLFREVFSSIICLPSLFLSALPLSSFLPAPFHSPRSGSLKFSPDERCNLLSEDSWPPQTHLVYLEPTELYSLMVATVIQFLLNKI